MVKESNDLFEQCARTQVHAAAHAQAAAERRRQYGPLLRPGGRLPQRDDQGTDAHHAPGIRAHRQQPRGALEGAGQGPDAINDDVESIYRRINQMLREGDFSDIEEVLTLRDQLFESIAEAIKSELCRINEAREHQGHDALSDDSQRDEEHGAPVAQPAQVAGVLPRAGGRKKPPATTAAPHGGGQGRESEGGTEGGQRERGRGGGAGEKRAE